METRKLYLGIKKSNLLWEQEHLNDKVDQVENLSNAILYSNPGMGFSDCNRTLCGERHRSRFYTACKMEGDFSSDEKLI